MKGYWDVSFEENGKSRRGAVTKGVDTERCVTISKIAVPLKVGSAMASVVGSVRSHGNP